MTIMDAEDYEKGVLAALGLDADRVPWSRWARAYERLSAALTEDREEVLEATASGSLGDGDTRAVAALVFGARSFVIARAVLQAYPAPEGLVAELGAGCGPFGLAASILGHPVELRDISAQSLELAPLLHRAASLPEPKCSVGSADALTGSNYAAIALAYSLNEMLARSGQDLGLASTWIARWLGRLSPGGRLYILEPGTKAQSRKLQMLRDRWQAHVIAPCPQGLRPCPLLVQAQDWCHFTWHHASGPVTRRLAQMTGRDAQHLRFSWLVLAKDPRATESESASRLLELRYPDKHKATAMLCCPQGDVIRLTALKRDEEAYSGLTALVPGTMIELNREGLEAKGDGLRLRQAMTIRTLRQL
jgi:hypothetical protein